jgi:hypothetical protein
MCTVRDLKNMQIQHIWKYETQQQHKIFQFVVKLISNKLLYSDILNLRGNLFKTHTTLLLKAMRPIMFLQL